MRIDIRQPAVSHGSRFEVTYKSDNVTITEDIYGEVQVNELRDEFLSAIIDLSHGAEGYLKRVLEDVDEDDIITYIIEKCGLEYLINEIAYQTGDEITINKMEDDA